MPGMTTTTIAEDVEAWPGVHGEHGSRGEYSFKVGAREIGPHGATFEDGYRAAEICDAMLRSADSRSREDVTFRS